MQRCICEGPGWCSRHRCQKNLHWWKLCQRKSQPEYATVTDYFDLWEQGRGPGQSMLDAPDVPSSEGPGVIRTAMNFGKAIVRHTLSGGRKVSDEVYEQRLAICRTCPSCELSTMRCREVSCGCWLSVKGRWASEECPLGRWPRVDTPQDSRD